MTFRNSIYRRNILESVMLDCLNFFRFSSQQTYIEMKWMHVAVLVFTLTLAKARLCDDDECDGVNCTERVVLDYEHQPPCKENQRYNSYGTYCGCCPACVDILEEGSPCSFRDDFDAPPDLWDCKKGLECDGRHCVGRETTTVDPNAD